MLFQFEHMDLDSVGGHINGKWALKPLHLPDLKATMMRWQEALAGQGWNSLYLGNHDQPRPVSRFGDDQHYRVESAKMLCTFLHGLQGTPYVYQGEELGMTNVAFPHIDDYRDIETLNMYRVAVQERGQDPAQVMRSIWAKSRDNARTPMQWSNTANAGFTTVTPWIALHSNVAQVNAEQALADADSVFHYYRRMIALRKTEPLLVDGHTTLLLPEHAQLVAYLRTPLHTGPGSGDQALLVVCNFAGTACEFALHPELHCNEAEVLLANYPVENVGLSQRLRALPLRPFEALLLRLR
jgi:oligo-1,6-glucosidase